MSCCEEILTVELAANHLYNVCQEIYARSRTKADVHGSSVQQIRNATRRPVLGPDALDTAYLDTELVDVKHCLPHLCACRLVSAV